MTGILMSEDLRRAASTPLGTRDRRTSCEVYNDAAPRTERRQEVCAAAAGQSAFFVQHASSAGETCFDVDTRSLPYSCHRISDGAETVVAAREFRRTWVG